MRISLFFYRAGSRLLVAAGLGICLSSCEDKDQVKKNEQLRYEISVLKKEIELLEISAGKDPGDQAKAIKETSDSLSKTLAELEALDKKREKLDQEFTAKEQEFRKYQKQYPVE